MSAITYDGISPATSGTRSHAPAVGDPVDDPRRQHLDARPHRLRDLRDELPGDDLAQRRVPRRVRHQHHLVVAELDAASSGIRMLGTDEKRGRVAAHRPDVGVAGDRPEPVAARLGVPVHRVVLAQPRELVVRLAVRERARREQIDVRHGRESARDPSGRARKATFTRRRRPRSLVRRGARLLRRPGRGLALGEDLDQPELLLADLVEPVARCRRCVHRPSVRISRTSTGWFHTAIFPPFAV